ncbi:MAG: nucleoside-diphosphate sugar epimerase/dehydratase [Rhodospirillaceae bacterium]
MTISRAAVVNLHDLVMTAAAVVLALELRVGGDIFSDYGPALSLFVPVAMASGAVAYRWFGLYRGIWRYASAPDMIQLVKAVTVLVLVFGAVAVLMPLVLPLPNSLPRSVPLILWFVLVVLLGGPRFGYRIFKDGRRIRRMIEEGLGEIPVLLIGVGDAAALFIGSLAHAPDAPYRVVGVLDDKDETRRVGRDIRGVPVLGGLVHLIEVVEGLDRRGLRPQRLILAKSQDEMPAKTLRRLLEQAEALGLPLSRLPSPTEFKEALGEGKVELRPIMLEDLLGRPQAVLDRGAIAGLVGGRRVLVSGAGGTIGSELTRQIAALRPSRLILIENGEFNLYTIDMELRERFPALDVRSVLADVRDRGRIAALFGEHRPELVFHAAALKHVPLVEECPAEGALTNVFGTRNVADAARAVGVLAMVLISTDKAVRPSSVMGATKRVAESYCQALDTLVMSSATPTRFVTVRFGNVLGSSGSVVPLFQRQLARGGPLTVTHPEMRRYFMTVREAVELVLQASAHGIAHPDERGRILVLDMGEPVRILELARQMIRLSGHKPGVDIRIEFVGLRPGEKLFEEILHEAEAPEPTEADGVFVAAPRLIDHQPLSAALTGLEAAARAGDHPAVVAQLRLLVPEYQTPASGYETASEPAKTACAVLPPVS